mmetsp:Transcript_67941/g.112558  ORF Transcript_67941/g.112558 Transcript_67941/m.112558 type:complete len:210 (-) Transcript_67941:37-666(-)
MGKQGDKRSSSKSAPPPPEPVVEEAPPEPVVEEAEPEPESMILKSFGWEVCKMPTSTNKYYYSAARRESRVQPPYFAILGLEEQKFRKFTKEDIWKAFFARKTEYKKMDQGALTEDLKNEEDGVDWALIMEAFHVLTNQQARAEYEQRNLMPHAQVQLTGLRVMHEARRREEARRALAAAEAAAKAAADAEAAAAEEAAADASPPSKKK